MLRIDRTLLADIEAHARGDHPRECCGLLIGSARGGTRHVVEVRPARNVTGQDAGSRFDLDPEDHWAAVRDARDRGLEVVGAYHSHPDQPAVASARDAQHAWRNASFLIVSVRQDVVHETRSFELRDGALQDEEVQCEPPEESAEA